MPKIEPPKWYNVNEDCRVWSGHAESAQHQGWLRAPAAILAIDEYQGSFQFEQVMVVDELGGADERMDNPGYPQYWIRIEDTSLKPYEGTDPLPEPDEEPDEEPPVLVTQPGDATLGAAFRIVWTFVAETLGYALRN